jgi:hypothetical protein
LKGHIAKHDIVRAKAMRKSCHFDEEQQGENSGGQFQDCYELIVRLGSSKHTSPHQLITHNPKLITPGSKKSSRY